MLIGLACSFLLTFHIDTSWYRNNCASFGANSTISALPSLSSADSNDLFPIVDTSAGQTKQITFSNATGSMSTYLNATYALKAGSSNIVTVGTITSGTWNGSTLTVPYGGTGSTTLSSNQLFAGNGTSPVQSIGWGISGQFLTSNGPGALPTFQTSAVNQASDYNWTGTNFLVKNLTASGTSANPIKFNGVSYAYPSTQGASSTYLCNNGSGTYYNCFPSVSVLYKSSASSSVTGSATATAATVTIPANTLGVSGMLRITAVVSGTGGGTKQYQLDFGTGSASTTFFQGSYDIGTQRELLTGYITNITTANQTLQGFLTTGTGGQASYTVALKGYQAESAVDTTSQSYLAFRCAESSASTCSFKSILVELVKAP